MPDSLQLVIGADLNGRPIAQAMCMANLHGLMGFAMKRSEKNYEIVLSLIMIATGIVGFMLLFFLSAGMFGRQFSMW